MTYFYFGIDVDDDKSACLSSHPAELRGSSYRLEDGEALTGWFPRPAVYPMDPDHPGARTLNDLQDNTLSMLVVSPALSETMQEAGCTNVEFLPIVIHNHRGKVASDGYSIANVLGLIDCLDRANSRYREDPIVPGKINRFDRLSLISSRIPPGLHIFRLKDRPQTHFVSEELRQAIEARRLRGMVFIPIDRYQSVSQRP